MDSATQLVLRFPPTVLVWAAQAHATLIPTVIEAHGLAYTEESTFHTAVNFGERSARKVQELTKGEVPDVESMWRALDFEGENVAEERTGNVGSRHRSAYRLCGALPGSVAVVISQDGSVHFVCQRGGRLTYWEQE
jgi:hypothetical protein